MVFVWVSCHGDGPRAGGDELQGSLGWRHRPRRSCLPKTIPVAVLRTISKYTSEAPAARGNGKQGLGATAGLRLGFSPLLLVAFPSA